MDSVTSCDDKLISCRKEILQNKSAVTQNLINQSRRVCAHGRAKLHSRASTLINFGSRALHYDHAKLEHGRAL